MLAQSLILLASAAATMATPVACPAPQPDPTLPKNGGPTELPAPAAGLKLEVIALGFGVQNYTCASAGATPVNTGAIAMFYDASSFFPGVGDQSLTIDEFNKLPGLAVETHDDPLRFNLSTAGRVDPKFPGVSQTWPFTPDAPLQLKGLKHSIPFLGHHFFDSKGEPEFVLNSGAIDLIAAKEASIPAPPTADKGPDGTGAVAWLALGAKPGSRGSKFVYRVETAGGNPHGCPKAGEDTTRYAAQYWFYN